VRSGRASATLPLLRFCPRCRSIFTAQVEFCAIDGTGLTETHGDPLVGHEVDRYRVLERIGIGATGCIYRVRHSVLEHEHAMKILYGDLGQDARLVERFKREAKAIGKMRHPNILTVTDFGRSQNGLVFLVMELLHGTTLLEEIADRAPIPPARVAAVLTHLASGLGEAHRLGYVHRDVKPSNVVLVDRDRIETLKILDFGIVGLRTEPLDARLTNSGFLVGTPQYMAPEQATDPSHVTPAADLYSLGVIAFEMLSGRLPFNATDPVDMIIQHSTSPVPKLPACGGLERLVEWMLQKRAGDRPQSAHQVLTELSCLDFEEVDTEADTSPGIAEVDFDVPLLEPITYVGTMPSLHGFQTLRDRLDRLQETMLRAPSELDVRSTFEPRMLRLLAALKPGLRSDEYLAIADEIDELEEELWDRVRFRPA
jgi:eukaryotic-like serine/threonine-protein kinase